MDRDSLCYGEISIAALAISLFEGAEATPSDSFLDLGSGSGKAVLAAAALGLRQVAGMELLPSLVELSMQLARPAFGRLGLLPSGRPTSFKAISSTKRSRGGQMRSGSLHTAGGHL